MAAVFDFETDPNVYSEAQLSAYYDVIPENPDDVLNSPHPTLTSVTVKAVPLTSGVMTFEPLDRFGYQPMTPPKLSASKPPLETVQTKSTPNLPLTLLNTNFRTEEPVELIVTKICRMFEETKLEVDYKVVRENCSICAVYLKGSLFCDLKIRIYYDGKSAHVVEAQRMQGDAFAFYYLYRDIRSLFVPPENDTCYWAAPERLKDLTAASIIEGQGLDVSASVSPDLSDSSQLTEEEIMAALKSVVLMTKDIYEAGRLEACRILCDLAYQVEIRHHMRDAGCINALADLFKISGEMIRQHVVAALADLSECQECQEAIIDSGMLPLLVDLAVDGPYFTGGMRRDSARALANIAERRPERVLDCVGREKLSRWFTTVDSLEDQRLKHIAARACDCVKALAH